MKFYITGRVSPERTAVHIPKFVRENPDYAKITFSCDASQISMIMETQLTELTSYLLAKDFANTVVTALGFANGCGYSAEIISITSEEGTMNVYGVSAPGLEFANPETIFNNYLQGALANVPLRYAIKDYLRAFTDAMECGYLCYRSIETIKNHFEVLHGEKMGWSKMHEFLGTTAENIKNVIKPFADPVRHGSYHEKIISTNIEQRTTMCLLTKDVIDRYYNYLVRNKLIPIERIIGVPIK